MWQVFICRFHHTCDVIKQNESELAKTVFKIQSNKADSFFCLLSFVQSFNCLYFYNQWLNLCEVFIKLKPKQYPNTKCQKNTKSYFWLQTNTCNNYRSVICVESANSFLPPIFCFFFIPFLFFLCFLLFHHFVQPFLLSPSPLVFDLLGHLNPKSLFGIIHCLLFTIYPYNEKNVHFLNQQSSLISLSQVTKKVNIIESSQSNWLLQQFMWTKHKVVKFIPCHILVW